MLAYMHIPKGKHMDVHQKSAAGNEAASESWDHHIKYMRSMNVRIVQDRLDRTNGMARRSTSRPPQGRSHHRPQTVSPLPSNMTTLVRTTLMNAPPAHQRTAGGSHVAPFRSWNALPGLPVTGMPSIDTAGADGFALDTQVPELTAAVD